MPDDQHRQNYVECTDNIVSYLHEISPVVFIITICIAWVSILVYVVKVHIAQKVYEYEQGPY